MGKQLELLEVHTDAMLATLKNKNILGTIYTLTLL
jgi:hypothetical protein